MTELSPAVQGVILALADDEHMIGSRHANWIGLGPFLEEDLAFCSIAQDELGHALALYELLMPASEIDRFALLRDPSEYRSCELAELACDSWDLALVRHWLYDTAESHRWRNFSGSSVTELGELAGQVVRDEEFHRSHAHMFMGRMAAEPMARAKLEAALSTLLPAASGLWVPTADEDDAIQQGAILASSSQLRDKWVAEIEEGLDTFGLTADLSPAFAAADRSVRSDGFEQFHTSLGEVISLDTSAIW